MTDRQQRTRTLRYKRPVLASMGYDHIQKELEEIIILVLRDEQLEVYENLHREQAKQIRMLKEYAALLKDAVGKEPCNL